MPCRKNYCKDLPPPPQEKMSGSTTVDGRRDRVKTRVSICVTVCIGVVGTAPSRVAKLKSPLSPVRATTIFLRKSWPCVRLYTVYIYVYSMYDD